MIVRIVIGTAISLSLLAAGAAGQTVTDSLHPGSPATWSYYASVYLYVLPEDNAYLSPIVMADLGTIHLEARYNYEDLKTGSAYVGWNFAAGEDLHLEATAMGGVVFGSSSGIAPGYRFDLEYHRFAVSSEGEYFFDVREHENNYFYNWSELNYTFTDWIHAGIAVQRTRAYRSELDLQRGFFAGYTNETIEGTLYVFNWGWTSPTWVFTLAYTF